MDFKKGDFIYLEDTLKADNGIQDHGIFLGCRNGQALVYWTGISNGEYSSKNDLGIVGEFPEYEDDNSFEIVSFIWLKLLYKKIAITKLSKKMYPKAEEKDGFLLIRSLNE